MLSHHNLKSYAFTPLVVPVRAVVMDHNLMQSSIERDVFDFKLS
jgi:hypothetical protein